MLERRDARRSRLRRTHAPIHYRPCIACGKMMNRVNFGRVSGTVIDVCRGHGTFLDAGELHAIVTFIRMAVSIAPANARSEELEDERHRLAMLKSQIDSVAIRRPTGNIGRPALLLEIRRLLKDERLTTPVGN